MKAEFAWWMEAVTRVGNISRICAQESTSIPGRSHFRRHFCVLSRSLHLSDEAAPATRVWYTVASVDVGTSKPHPTTKDGTRIKVLATTA